LENILRTSIEPRIFGIYFHPFKLSNNNFLIIIYIPKSFNPPHVVNFQGHWRFYTRHSNGKHQMDLSEVKTSLNLSENLGERIKNFRLERISRIISNDVNVPLIDSPKIVIHLLPLASVDKGHRLDLSVYLNNYQNLRPLFGSTSFQRFNLDRFLTYSTTSDYKTAEAYLLLFCTGIIESINAITLTLSGQSRKSFQIEAFAKGIINELYRFLDELKNLNVNCPIILMITFLSIKDYWMDSSNPYLHADNSVDRDILLLPEVIINDYSERVELLIKPIFDSLWQAFCFSKCRHYNDKGEWVLK